MSVCQISANTTIVLLFIHIQRATMNHCNKISHKDWHFSVEYLFGIIFKMYREPGGVFTPMNYVHSIYCFSVHILYVLHSKMWFL